MPDITTPDGYMERFWELVSEKQAERAPMRSSLKALENELLEQYGVRRYKSYGSFAATRGRKPKRIAFKTV